MVFNSYVKSTTNGCFVWGCCFAWTYSTLSTIVWGWSLDCLSRRKQHGKEGLSGMPDLLAPEPASLLLKGHCSWVQWCWLKFLFGRFMLPRISEILQTTRLYFPSLQYLLPALQYEKEKLSHEEKPSDEWLMIIWSLSLNEEIQGSFWAVSVLNECSHESILVWNWRKWCLQGL